MLPRPDGTICIPTVRRRIFMAHPGCWPRFAASRSLGRSTTPTLTLSLYSAMHKESGGVCVLLLPGLLAAANRGQHPGAMKILRWMASTTFRQSRSVPHPPPRALSTRPCPAQVRTSTVGCSSPTGWGMVSPALPHCNDMDHMMPTVI